MTGDTHDNLIGGAYCCVCFTSEPRVAAQTLTEPSTDDNAAPPELPHNTAPPPEMPHQLGSRSPTAGIDTVGVNASPSPLKSTQQPTDAKLCLHAQVKELQKAVVPIEPISAAVVRYAAAAALGRKRVNVNSSDNDSEVGISDEDELMAALMDADRQDAEPTERLQRPRGRAPSGKRWDRRVGWVDDDHNSSSATTSEDDNGDSSDESGSYQRNPKIKRVRGSLKQEGIVTDACKKCSRQALPANYGFCAKHRTSKKNASTAASKRTARRNQQESSVEESSGDEENVRQTEGRAERRARREQQQSSDDDDDDDDKSSEEEDDTEGAVPRESKAKAGGGQRKKRKRSDVYNEQLQRWESIGKAG